MSELSPKQFAKELKKGENIFLREAAGKVLAAGLKIQKEAAKNFTGNDGQTGLNVGPRSITGNLRRSLMTKLTKKGSSIEAHITAGLKNPVEYAAALEFGYQRILPRFYIGRAFDKVLPTIDPDLQKVLSVALSGKGTPNA